MMILSNHSCHENRSRFCCCNCTTSRFEKNRTEFLGNVLTLVAFEYYFRVMLFLLFLLSVLSLRLVVYI
jgi:hypothetical protein